MSMEPGPGMDLASLSPGFAAPVEGAQAAFRVVLEAMAHPGRILGLPEAAIVPPAPGLGIAATAILLALTDDGTPLWTDGAAAGALAHFRFHTGARAATGPEAAAFAAIADAEHLPPLGAFDHGTDEYPDRSTTLVIEVAELAAQAGRLLRGPGIDGTAPLRVVGLGERFWEEREALRPLFPRGLDVILTCGARLAALPRTTET